MIRGRKGDLSVSLFTLMVVVLFGAALFSYFIHMRSTTRALADEQYMESVLSKEDLIRFYISHAGERAYVESYKILVSNGMVSKLSDLDGPRLKVAFKEEFAKRFIDAIKGYSFSDSAFGEMQRNVVAGKFYVQPDDGNFIIGVSDVSIVGSLRLVNKKREWVWYVIPTPFVSEEIVSQTGLIYRPDLKVRISAQSAGLESFDKIYGSVEGCLEEDKGRDCFASKLRLFDVEVSKKESASNISLVSKKAFFEGTEMKKVSFSFLVN